MMSQEDFPPVPADPLQPTIFHEPWWLEIATGNSYAVAEVSEHGQVIGRLPYMMTRRFGLKIVEPPPLTHFLGPVFLKAPGKPTSSQIHHQDVVRALINQLPAASRHKIHCQREISDVTAFQAEGFIATVQFTREIAPQPVEALWASLRKKARNNILQAERKFALDSAVSPDEFMKFYSRNLKERNTDSYLDLSVCTKLLEGAIARGRGAIFGARDDTRNLSTATVCVWDAGAVYWLMCTRQTEANRGAISMLVWEAIKSAMAKGLIFDFDGFASEGGVRFSASFSANVVPRYIVTRDSVPLQLLRTLRSTVVKPNYFCV